MSNQVDRFQIETDCKRIWAVDPGVRSEFGTLETYMAYRVADANGQIKYVGKRSAAQERTQ